MTNLRQVIEFCLKTEEELEQTEPHKKINLIRWQLEKFRELNPGMTKDQSRMALTYIKTALRMIKTC